jgi:hypothetical protein
MRLYVLFHQQLFRIFRPHGPIVEESLGFIACVHGQEIHLILGFNSFRDNIHVQILCQLNDDSGDRIVLVAFGYAVNKLHIHFDAINRKIFQPGQRRVLGAKIINRDGDAELVQRVQDRFDIDGPLMATLSVISISRDFGLICAS